MSHQNLHHQSVFLPLEMVGVRSAHPDLGGSHERMVELNAAYVAARTEVLG